MCASIDVEQRKLQVKEHLMEHTYTHGYDC